MGDLVLRKPFQNKMDTKDGILLSSSVGMLFLDSQFYFKENINHFKSYFQSFFIEKQNTINISNQNTSFTYKKSIFIFPKNQFIIFIL